jgi:hypothetical protein
MKNLIVTNLLLCVFMVAMSLALEFVFDEHVAGLLAASATWSLPIFLSSLDHISLAHRRRFFGGSSFALVMIIFNIAYLIVGAKPHVFVPIAVVVLMLPAIAINVLLERILFTDEERLEIKSHNSQRTQVV